MSACLHWALVNAYAVKLFGSLCSETRLAEDHIGNATTLSVLVVLEGDSLDAANGLMEVLLCSREMISMLVAIVKYG